MAFLASFIGDDGRHDPVGPGPDGGQADVPVDYDPDRYRKFQNYLGVNTRFGWITESLDLAVILVFWFAGGFPALDAWAARSFGRGPVVTGLIFVAALTLLKSVTDLPFSVYHTFVIEARFGFNRPTVKTFISDLLKGWALSAFLCFSTTPIRRWWSGSRRCGTADLSGFCFRWTPARRFRVQDRSNLC